MKKLLSLLSVLTISGTAVPTTIAASPYQKNFKINTIINKNDIFEKSYKFLEHDELKIKLSSETAFKIINYFEENNEKEFFKKTTELISILPKLDHTGLGGKITSEDIKTTSKFIWEHFAYFFETCRNLKKEQFIFIKTNTIGYWDFENPNNNIYVEYNKNNLSRIKRDAINYKWMGFNKNNVLYTFSRKTWDEIKNIHDSAIGSVWGGWPSSGYISFADNLSKKMINVPKDFRISQAGIDNLINTIWLKFEDIKNFIEKSYENHFTIVINHELVRPDKKTYFILLEETNPGTVDNTIQKIITQFGVGTACAGVGAALGFVAGPITSAIGATVLGGICGVISSNI